jgi:cation-transporting ATPase E
VLFYGLIITISTLVRDEVTIQIALQSASVVFGLAPASLFLMIVLAYALGAVQLADQGALVQQANSIESLAHVTVLCLDKTGTLTANRIQLQTAHPLHTDHRDLRCQRVGAECHQSGDRGRDAGGKAGLPGRNSVFFSP